MPDKNKNKLYCLKKGTFVAYKVDGHWHYTDKKGVRRLCGKHSCLKSFTVKTPDTRNIPNSNYNRKAAEALFDSLDICTYGFVEAPDAHFNLKNTNLYNYSKTLERWYTIWKGFHCYSDTVSNAGSKMYFAWSYAEGMGFCDGQEDDEWMTQFNSRRSQYIAAVVFR